MLLRIRPAVPKGLDLSWGGTSYGRKRLETPGSASTLKLSSSPIVPVFPGNSPVSESPHHPIRFEMLLTAAMSTSIRAHSNNLGQAKAPRSADLSGCAATNVGDGATKEQLQVLCLLFAVVVLRL